MKRSENVKIYTLKQFTTETLVQVHLSFFLFCHISQFQ